MVNTRPQKRHVKPVNRFRLAIFNIVMTAWFEAVMGVIIVANVVTLMMVHEGQNHTWDMALAAANVGFTGLFTIEMLLKWTAIGVKAYFQVRQTEQAASLH